MGHAQPALATVDAGYDDIDSVIAEASEWLVRRQAEDGHWVFELEADATIPSEYILLNHFLGEIDDIIEQRIAAYLRRTQGADGGWPLYHDGECDISATVKAYYALKLVGDDPDAPHMRRAREAVLARGGAARSNVFTRFTLALFGQVPWRATPFMRVEAVLLPRWAPFHVHKVSYWSRTVMLPLLVLAVQKARARNPRGVGIQELFSEPPEAQRTYLANPTGHWLGNVFLAVDRVGRRLEWLLPRALERHATNKAMAFVRERLNGEDGLGGIFPAMANALMAFRTLGYPADHPDVVTARRAIDRLLVVRPDEAYCQPCLSPVWDTCLALHGLLEAGHGSDEAVVQKACTWLRDGQVLDVVGDYAAHVPSVRPGGWPFQYRNDHYPDVDDTAVVVMGLQRADGGRSSEAVERGIEWVLGMQSRNGGWGAFDANNEYYVLNHIPFADHGALLDPPSSDVTARCLGMLAQAGLDRDHPAVAAGIRFLKAEQEADGSWFGRWGTNYIYGTWSVLSALNAVGEDPEQPYIRRAVAWLKARQLADGSWGEDCASYWPHRRDEVKAGTPTQTAWAVLALMAVGEVDSAAVRRGVDHLVTAPREGGHWREEYYNAVGFPRVFYLRYHGYSAYFPLWALARYRNLRQANARRPGFGI
jgi:squalene-hopene/tetraprenyl-beta-curcumene cyclase